VWSGVVSQGKEEEEEEKSAKIRFSARQENFSCFSKNHVAVLDGGISGARSNGARAG